MADFRIPLSHSVGDEGKSFAASFASFDFVLYFLALGILLPDLLFLWSWTSIYNNFWHGLYTRIKIAPLISLVMRCFFLALNGPGRNRPISCSFRALAAVGLDVLGSDGFFFYRFG